MKHFAKIHPTGTIDLLVRRMVEIMNEQRVTCRHVVKAAGVNKSALTEWLHNGYTPRIGNLEACLNVLGYELVIQPRLK